MKRFFIIVAIISLNYNVCAASQKFGDWYVVKADNGDMVAGTAKDNLTKFLIYRCFKDLQKCVHVLVPDIVCDEGHKYPILVNSDEGALSLQGICGGGKNRHELVLTDFDGIHNVLKKSGVIGFAIPMESGKFKVIRFSLKGSSKAMDTAEAKVIDSSEYL